MVTSSAVVGSSAISSLGLQATRHGDHHALAHAAGELVRIGVHALVGAGDARPAAAARSRAPRVASPARSFSWSFSTSAIWPADGRDGLRLVIGSWKIMAISRPRSCRIGARRSSFSRSCAFEGDPADWGLLPHCAAGGCIRAECA